MQLILKLFLITSLLSGFSNTNAAPAATENMDNILPNFKATYALKKAGLTAAETVVEFSHDNKTFSYSSHSKTVGLVAIFRNDKIMEKTSGRWNQGEIQPETYRYQRTGKKAKTKKIDFDWKTNKATYEENTNKTAIELRKNTIDEFSNQLVMMLDLMKQPSKEKDKFTYPVIDDGLIKDRAFIIEGKEIIKVKAGSFESVKIKRFRAEGKKRTTYFWCAKELYQLPVKIEHIESNGGKLSLELVKVEGI